LSHPRYDGEKGGVREMSTITIDRDIAKIFVDEMLAQAKYARISPKSLVDLMNELRMGLLKPEIIIINKKEKK
jgi:hypothetical protein